MDAPAWALTIAYWLHMLATVLWIGSLATLALLVLPAAARLLDEQAQIRFLERLQKQLDPLGWFCLVLLVGTGMFQMSANPNYAGFLDIANRWAAAILIKHILFLAMIGISAMLTWGILPEIRRTLLRQAQGMVTDTAPLRRRNLLWLRLNLALAVIILALTAIARVS